MQRLKIVNNYQSRRFNVGFGRQCGITAETIPALVENARRKQSQKHGGHMQRVALDGDTGVIENSVDGLLALDEALTRFEQQWPDKAKLVKMKYFAGLTVPEAARAIDISTPNAERYWKFARVAAFPTARQCSEET